MGKNQESKDLGSGGGFPTNGMVAWEREWDSF